MLIQRRSSCSTISTLGSAGGAETGAPGRPERRSRGRGRFGIASERVVLDRRHHVSILLGPRITSLFVPDKRERLRRGRARVRTEEDGVRGYCWHAFFAHDVLCPRLP